jgi:hypothetical protein
MGGGTGEYMVKRRGRAMPNFPVRRGDGRGDDNGGDGGELYARRTTKRLTGGASLPAGGSARERAAGRWVRLVSERDWGSGAAARARETGRKWAERGRNVGARGESGRAWAGFSPANRGAGFSLFLFIF